MSDSVLRWSRNVAALKAARSMSRTVGHSRPFRHTYCCASYPAAPLLPGLHSGTHGVGVWATKLTEFSRIWLLSATPNGRAARMNTERRGTACISTLRLDDPAPHISERKSRADKRHQKANGARYEYPELGGRVVTGHGRIWKLVCLDIGGEGRSRSDGSAAVQAVYGQDAGL